MHALAIVDKLINKIDAVTRMSTIQDDQKQQAPTTQLLMIPGPTEFDPVVYSQLARKTVSHVDPSFISEFGECLDNFNKLLCATPDCQPFILSGGGTLGWDCIVSSLTESELNDHALILNGGYFSDNYRECCKAYGIGVIEISASCIGDVVTTQQLENYLTDPLNVDAIKKIKLVCITQVDTSTAVCIDVRGVSLLCRKYIPSAFITVDGVCAFIGCEFRFSQWGIDAAMTASQKAFGCPPGLCMITISGRANDYMLNNRQNPIHSFYSSLARWQPIMKSYQNRTKSYFSTPNVNLIRALNESCKLLVREGIDRIVKRHLVYSSAFRESMKSIGLEFVPIRNNIYSSTITAIQYPNDINGSELLKIIKKDCGIIFAGGLHKDIKSKYFRVGHMGYSMKKGSNHLLKCVKAIEYGLDKCGYHFKKGVAVHTYQQAIKKQQQSTNIIT